MTAPLLEITDLQVRFAQDGTMRPAVRGVSLHVNPGETVAIVGESGSGKSVTALSSVGLLPPSAEVAGSVRYNGAEMIGAPERSCARCGATISASSSRSR